MSEENPITEDQLPKPKTSKELNKMFKSITEAGPYGGAMEGFFNILSLLEPVLKPLEVIFQVVGSLFQVMGAEIMPPLMEALDPVIEALISLTPVFADLGRMIGEALAEILPPLINLFLMLFQAIVPLIPKLLQLIQVFVDLVVKAMPLILPILTNIVNIIIAVLQPILDWLSTLNPHELALVIYFLGLGLTALYGLYTGGPWMALLYAGLWAALMSPLLFMQEGGLVLGPTAAVVGEGGPEVVAPLDRFEAMLAARGGEETAGAMRQFNTRIDEMATLQEETNTLLRGIYKDKVFRHELRRGF